jgi:hypothetical protein
VASLVYQIRRDDREILAMGEQRGAGIRVDT